MFKKILIFCACCIFSIQISNAKCNADIAVFTKLSEVCWDCMLPIKIAGASVQSGYMAEGLNRVNSAICTCPGKFNGLPQVGIPLGWYGLDRVLDVVSDPLCFPSLGIDSAKDGGFMQQFGSSMSKSVSHGATFMQVHEIYFVATAILDIFTDTACVTKGNVIDISFLTEFDPMWQSSALSSILSPDAILYANPVTNLSCISDSTSSQANFPQDPLFWCKGSWGNVFPLSGWASKQGMIVDSASVAATFMFKMHRELLTWNTSGHSALCFSHPLPLWIKTSNRLQLAHPIAHPTGMGIGQTGLLWDSGKNPPFMGDNFSYFWFRKHDCCAL